MKLIKSLFKLVVSAVRFIVIVGLIVALAYFADKGQAKARKAKNAKAERVRRS